jgi:predicted NAD/FAD-binding protein
MNKLQQQDVKKNYFVSINPFYKIDETKIIKEIQYDHPLFTRENFALQEKLQELNTHTNVLFCGSYF